MPTLWMIGVLANFDNFFCSILGVGIWNYMRITSLSETSFFFYFREKCTSLHWEVIWITQTKIITTSRDIKPKECCSRTTVCSFLEVFHSYRLSTVPFIPKNGSDIFWRKLPYVYMEICHHSPRCHFTLNKQGEKKQAVAIFDSKISCFHLQDPYRIRP